MHVYLLLVCFVLMLFVNVCHEWTCEFKNVKFLVGFVPYCDVRFEICDADLWGDIATPNTPRCAAIKFVIRISSARYFSGI